MGSTGYVDWHRLDRTMPWVRQRGGQRTYVFAFWAAEYHGYGRDHGIQLLKDVGAHPDWFLYAETADHVLAAYPHPKSMVSPNLGDIFTNSPLESRPLLASVLLGTADAVYRTNGGCMWWASSGDLTRRGKKLVNELNRLYERDSTLITFVENATDENTVPRDPR